MLVIHPDECIDCGVCEPGVLQPRRSSFPIPSRASNNGQAERRPAPNRPEHHGQAGMRLPDAKEFDCRADKFKDFSDKPGEGD